MISEEQLFVLWVFSFTVRDGVLNHADFLERKDLCFQVMVCLGEDFDGKVR